MASKRAKPVGCAATAGEWGDPGDAARRCCVPLNTRTDGHHAGVAWGIKH